MKRMMLLLSIAAGFTVCSGVNAALAYTRNFSTELTMEDPLFKGLNQFKADVEKRAAGRLKSSCSPTRNSVRMKTFSSRRVPAGRAVFARLGLRVVTAMPCPAR